jgi:MinD-like ATPase involved in chromosome partitioning or flagellar assembly
MSLVALAAGRGSRGVTTATLALAATWPRAAVVAECDPAGGCLAARFKMEPLPGMLSLASAARHGLDPAMVGAHVRPLPVGLPALIGATKAEQAEALSQLWPSIAPVLTRLPEVDVLADCGRVGPHTPTLELLRNADLVVVVAEPTLDGLEQLKDRLAALAAELVGPARQVPNLAALVLGDRPYPPGEVEAWLAEQHLAIGEVAVLADDPRAAAKLGGVPGRGDLRRSLLLRSARAAAERLHQHVASQDHAADGDHADQKRIGDSAGIKPAAESSVAAAIPHRMEPKV